MWYIFRQMNAAKPQVIYEKRKARQAKLTRALPSASMSSVAFDPNASDTNIPLTAPNMGDRRMSQQQYPFGQQYQYGSHSPVGGYAARGGGGGVYAPQPVYAVPKDDGDISDEGGSTESGGSGTVLFSEPGGGVRSYDRQKQQQYHEREQQRRNTRTRQARMSTDEVGFEMGGYGEAGERGRTPPGIGVEPIPPRRVTSPESYAQQQDPRYQYPQQQERYQQGQQQQQQPPHNSPPSQYQSQYQQPQPFQQHFQQQQQYQQSTIPPTPDYIVHTPATQGQFVAVTSPASPPNPYGPGRSLSQPYPQDQQPPPQPHPQYATRSQSQSRNQNGSQYQLPAIAGVSPLSSPSVYQPNATPRQQQYVPSTPKQEYFGAPQQQQPPQEYYIPPPGQYQQSQQEGIPPVLQAAGQSQSQGGHAAEPTGMSYHTAMGSEESDAGYVPGGYEQGPPSYR